MPGHGYPLAEELAASLTFDTPCEELTLNWEIPDFHRLYADSAVENGEGGEIAMRYFFGGSRTRSNPTNPPLNVFSKWGFLLKQSQDGGALTTRDSLDLIMSYRGSEERKHAMAGKFEAYVLKKSTNQFIFECGIPRTIFTNCAIYPDDLGNGCVGFTSLGELMRKGYLTKEDDTLEFKFKVTVYEKKDYVHEERRGENGNANHDGCDNCENPAPGGSNGRKNSHSNNFLQRSLTQDLTRLWETREGADFSFMVRTRVFMQNGKFNDIAGLKLIRAHKFMLTARSPYFARIFCGAATATPAAAGENGAFSGESLDELVVEDLAPMTIHTILKYIYTDKLDLETISTRNPHSSTGLFELELLSAAERYELASLRGYLERKVEQSVTPANAPKRLKIAKKLNLPKVSQSTREFMLENMPKIIDAWENTDDK